MTALEPQLLRFPTRGASAHYAQIQRAWSGGCSGHWDGGCQQDCLDMDGDGGMGMDASRLQGMALVGIPSGAAVPQTPLETPHGSRWAGWHMPIPGCPSPCSPPLSRAGFPRSSPPAIPSMSPICIPLVVCCSGHRGAGLALTRLILREGSEHWNIPCAPKVWLPTCIPRDQTISFDLSDEVTPKLPGSSLLELLTCHSTTS